MTTRAALTLVVPTFNNPEQLKDALESLRDKTDFQRVIPWVDVDRQGGRLIIVNNGQTSIPFVLDYADLAQRTNLGWEGGVNAGLAQTWEKYETPFFAMSNDDVVFDDHSFFAKLLSHFDDPKVGGVGPISDYVSGLQHSRITGLPMIHETTFLIGFFAIYRTELLKSLGGLDAALGGGDDLDLSIRVRKAGYKLLVDRRAFLHHIGAQTGTRVKGERAKPDGWDSAQHQHRTMNALIRKHGLRTWFETVVQARPVEYDPNAHNEGVITTEKLFADGSSMPVHNYTDSLGGFHTLAGGFGGEVKK